MMIYLYLFVSYYEDNQIYQKTFYKYQTLNYISIIPTNIIVIIVYRTSTVLNDCYIDNGNNIVILYKVQHSFCASKWTQLNVEILNKTTAEVQIQYNNNKY